MEKYKPQYPLPDELQQMARDDTVCKFCGVSYLIHNEIKALEEKLAVCEAELKRLKGSDERERQLRCELKVALAEKSVVDAQLVDKDSTMGILKKSLEMAELKVTHLLSDNGVLKERLVSEESTLKSLRQDYRHLQQTLPAIVLKLREERRGIHIVREILNKHLLLNDDGTKHIQQMLATHAARIETDKLERNNLQQKLRDELLHNKDLNSQLQEARSLITSSDQMQLKLNDALDAKDKAVHVTKELSATLSASEEKSHQLQMEAEQYKQQLKNMKQDYENRNAQLQNKVEAFENTMSSLRCELKETQTEVKHYRGLHEDFQKEAATVKRLQAEKEREAALSKDEVVSVKERLTQALSDLEAFKREREQMISAHQNRIEDLRESFKRKMADAETWPHKMDQALRDLKAEHQAELLAFQNSMKENFVLEMDIEKNKHQQLLEKVKVELQAEINKLRVQLKEQISSSAEVNSLKQQLKNQKAESLGAEARLRSEVESLKNIIADLENRLGKLDSGNQELVMQLRAELADKQRQLQSQNQVVEKLEAEIRQLQEQLQLLQDTVRRECEERMEILDSLAEAREELLRLKRPPGGYASPSLKGSNSGRKTPTILNTKSSQGQTYDRSESRSSSYLSESPGNRMAHDALSNNTAGRNEELSIYKKLAQTSSKPAEKAVHINVGFEGDGSKNNPLRALKGMDDGQKKKIAGIMSRYGP